MLSLLNCSFQLTTSRRGRRAEFWGHTVQPHFNSRPHEEVDDESLRQQTRELAFQLTTSRRGRLTVMVNALFPGYFNSRPHEEVDLYALLDSAHGGRFQLTTSRRGRRQFLRKKFSFPNYFLCLLHIIYSYYINTIFFSTLFFAKSSFFLVRIP